MAAAAAPARSVALSIDHAWNAVALEERLELLSRAHAHGILAGIASVLLLGTIAWGFDQIYILAGGFLAAFFMVPMFMSHSWRRGKPALILAYLAVRTVARRYAYGHNLSDLDIVLIYRGTMAEIYHDREEAELIKQRQQVDFSSSAGDTEKPVWICLLRGAVVILSERDGGAKLEYLTPITNEVTLRKRRNEEEVNDNAMVIEGTAVSKGRIIALSSRSMGAQYVFEKQLGRLIAEYKPPVSPYHTSRSSSSSSSSSDD